MAGAQPAQQRGLGTVPLNAVTTFCPTTCSSGIVGGSTIGETARAASSGADAQGTAAG